MTKTGSFLLERELLSNNYKLICGLDEAGRGCLCGPVVAGACILDPENIPEGINDSKKISPVKREKLYHRLKETSIAWAVGIVDSETIDKINILEASRLAMRRAVENLSLKPDILLIDALLINSLKIKQISYIKGDEEVLSIGAASIIAKVARDSIMEDLHCKYPHYNWSSNKGYPTKEHREALQKYGITPFHRKSFKGVIN